MRLIRNTRGQRAENPRWTERWRGVLRHVPQRTVQRPPCVPLALTGYECELRSCTSTARRPYGIPTRTVWLYVMLCYGRRVAGSRRPAIKAQRRNCPLSKRHGRHHLPVEVVEHLVQFFTRRGKSLADLALDVDEDDVEAWEQLWDTVAEDAGVDTSSDRLASRRVVLCST